MSRMSYRFRLKEPIPKGIRRIGREQLSTAIKALSDSEDIHRAIHKTRKRIKCLRSLLHLIRSGLEKPVYSTENKSYRDIGRQLSGARDAQAMLETLMKLDARAGNYPEKLNTAPIRTWLYDRHREAEQRLTKDSLTDVLAQLQERKKRFTRLSLKQIVFPVIAEGVKATYKNGRTAFSRAVATHDGEQFHEWRKDAQRHWRQMQLVRPCWPQMMDMRAKQAHELSQFLGDDHDLEVFGVMLKKHGSLFEEKVDLELLQRHRKEAQEELRGSSITYGQLLYVEKPRHFQQRLSSCWKASVGS